MLKKFFVFAFIPYSFCHAQIQSVGDLMLGENPYIYKTLLEPTDSILKSNKHINTFNLEGTIHQDKRLFPKCFTGTYCYTFKMDPTAAQILSNYFQIANIANNHSMDYGVQGQKLTTDYLLQNYIRPVGNKSFPVSRYGRFSFIGSSVHQGTIHLHDPELIDIIKHEKKLNQIVVLNAHIGKEGANAWEVKNEDEIYLGQNRGNPVEFAHKMIDTGVDLFIGHGPHVMRSLELYKDRLIAYSLGNFLTYGSFNLGGNSVYGGILRVEMDLDGKFECGQFFGFEQTKQINPVLWRKYIALQRSQKSLQFLQWMTHKHQPQMFNWTTDGKFSKNNFEKCLTQ